MYVHCHWSNTCIKYEHVNDGDILCICMTPLCIHLIYVPSLVGGFSFFGTVDCVWTQILYYAWIQTVHEILIGLSSLKLNGDVDGSVTRIFLRIFEILNPSTTKNEQIQTKLSMKFCWWETVMTRRLFSAIYHMYPNSHTPRPPVVNLRFTVRSFLQLGPNIMIVLVLVGTCS